MTGLSQEELSNRAGVERSHMGKIERGEHLPNLVMILRLAKAMETLPGALVDRTVELLN
jgi:transcriptional regulator with XRE-family HTH domain